jgi:hypothetical protein
MQCLVGMHNSDSWLIKMQTTQYIESGGLQQLLDENVMAFGPIWHHPGSSLLDIRRVL